MKNIGESVHVLSVSPGSRVCAYKMEIISWTNQEIVLRSTTGFVKEVVIKAVNCELHDDQLTAPPVVEAKLTAVDFLGIAKEHPLPKSYFHDLHDYILLIDVQQPE